MYIYRDYTYIYKYIYIHTYGYIYTHKKDKGRFTVQSRRSRIPIQLLGTRRTHNMQCFKIQTTSLWLQTKRLSPVVLTVAHLSKAKKQNSPAFHSPWQFPTVMYCCTALQESSSFQSSFQFWNRKDECPHSLVPPFQGALKGHQTLQNFAHSLLRLQPCERNSAVGKRSELRDADMVEQKVATPLQKCAKPVLRSYIASQVALSSLAGGALSHSIFFDISCW